MSDQRENQELNQRRRGLEAQLENSIRDTNTNRQETKDLQGAAEKMRDLKEKINAQHTEVKGDPGKPSGDSA